MTMEALTTQWAKGQLCENNNLKSSKLLLRKSQDFKIVDYFTRCCKSKSKAEDKEFQRFYDVCKGNTDLAKRKLKLYQEFKAKNEKYVRKFRKNADFFRICRKNIFGILPEVTDGSGSRVGLLVGVIGNWSVKDVKLEDLFGFIWESLERLTSCDDIFGNGVTLLLDFRGMTQQHLDVISSPKTTAFLKAFQIGFPLQIKDVHIVGSNPFSEKLLKIVEPYLTEKIRQRTILHGANLEADSLKEIPVEDLPSEFNGLAGKFNNKEWIRDMKDTVSYRKFWIPVLFIMQVVLWCTFALMLNLEYKQKPLQAREEDSATIKKEIKEFRSLVLEKVPDAYTEDKFLLKFLRAKEFDHDAALRRLRNYHRFRMSYPDVFQNLNIDEMEQFFKANVVGALDKKENGTLAVLFMNLDAWDVSVMGGYDIMRLMIFTSEMLSQMDSVQKNGVVMLSSVQNIGFYHLTELISTIPMMMKYVKGIPLRMVKILVLNRENQFFKTAFNLAMSISPPDMASKVLYLESLQELQKNLDLNILPTELGGTEGPFDTSNWIEVLKTIRNGTLEEYKSG